MLLLSFYKVYAYGLHFFKVKCDSFQYLMMVGGATCIPSLDLPLKSLQIALSFEAIKSSKQFHTHQRKFEPTYIPKTISFI